MPMEAMVVDARSALAPGAFSHPRYRIKRPFWQVFGRKFRVLAPDGSLVMFIKHPIFKLREEFTVFADEAQTQPLLRVKSRQVIAINRAFEVWDALAGTFMGTIQARGIKSIVRDTWDILDAQETPIGLMQEEGAALLRRFLPFLTSKHRIEIGGETVVRMRQIFRFFVKEFELDVSLGQGRIDTRFAIACGLLALMAEARREERN